MWALYIGYLGIDHPFGALDEDCAAHEPDEALAYEDRLIVAKFNILDGILHSTIY
jgi:hypothetical protein